MEHSRSSTQLLVLGLLLVLQIALAMETMGPIAPCETEGQRLADRASCTRFHICRADDAGVFVTDLLICPDDMVFDMVQTACVSVSSLARIGGTSSRGYLQDPASCTTFYGCHATRETSEGFVRRHYACSGDLRFHPTDRYCTFKTRVPDNLCNSRDAEQAIIGTDSSAAEGGGAAGSDTVSSGSTSGGSSSSGSSSGSTNGGSNSGGSSTFLTRRQGSPVRTTARSGFRTFTTEAVKETTAPAEGQGTSSTDAPSPLFSDDSPSPYLSTTSLNTASDISRVTAVIRNQLLQFDDPPYGMPGHVPGSVITHAQLTALDTLDNTT